MSLSNQGKAEAKECPLDIHEELLLNQDTIPFWLQSPHALIIVRNPHAINNLVLTSIFRRLQLSDAIR